MNRIALITRSKDQPLPRVRVQIFEAITEARRLRLDQERYEKQLKELYDRLMNKSMFMLPAGDVAWIKAYQKTRLGRH